MFRNHEPPPVVDYSAVRCPVRVASGRLAPGPHARLPRLAEAVAREISNCEFKRFEELEHLGPMQDPAAVAADIASFFGKIQSGRKQGPKPRSKL